jgi:putative endopeptidase
MDSVTIESQGLTPLNDQLQMINSIKTKDDVLHTMAMFQINIGSPMFSAAIYQDEMNSTKYTLHFYQGGIGLPDRDYYFNTDARTTNVRKEYKDHLKQMFISDG